MIRTRSMLRRRIIFLASGKANGSQPIWGSGSKRLPTSRARGLRPRSFLPVEEGWLGELVRVPERSFLMNFLKPKGRSRVQVGCTVTLCGTCCKRVRSLPTAGALRAVSTSTRMSFSGRYLARLTARNTPTPPAGGNENVIRRTFNVSVTPTPILAYFWGPGGIRIAGRGLPVLDFFT